jgi:hypothetical protein
MRTTVLPVVLGAFSMTMLLAALSWRLGAHGASRRRVRRDARGSSDGEAFVLASPDGARGSDAGADDCGDAGSDAGSDGGCDGGGSD